MNLNTICERYGNELDRIGKRLGIGAREDVACALLLQALADGLRASGEQLPPREKVTPQGPWPEDVRHASELEADRARVAERIATLLGR